jgi:surfeit locus 1 family protein
MGAFLIEPLERGNAPALLVERGWVPDNRIRPLEQPNGTVTVTGFIHPAERPGWFSASDDPANRTFYTLNPAAIGAALGLHNVAPFVLVALGPADPGTWPAPAQHLPRPPNNHLQYAITWYGLAVALVVIFLSWSRKVLRE